MLLLEQKVRQILFRNFSREIKVDKFDCFLLTNFIETFDFFVCYLTLCYFHYILTYTLE